MYTLIKKIFKEYKSFIRLKFEGFWSALAIFIVNQYFKDFQFKRLTFYINLLVKIVCF